MKEEADRGRRIAASLQDLLGRPAALILEHVRAVLVCGLLPLGEAFEPEVAARSLQKGLGLAARA